MGSDPPRLIAIGLLSIVNLGSVNDSADRVMLEVSEPLADLGTARALFNDNATLLLAYVAEQGPAKRAQIEQQIAANDATIDEHRSLAETALSAATREMSVQTEEAVASAATLAEMATQLDALVARFTLETEAAGTRAPARGHEVVRRRRASDWSRVA